MRGASSEVEIDPALQVETRQHRLDHTYDDDDEEEDRYEDSSSPTGNLRPVQPTKARYDPHHGQRNIHSTSPHSEHDELEDDEREEHGHRSRNNNLSSGQHAGNGGNGSGQENLPGDPQQILALLKTVSQFNPDPNQPNNHPHMNYPPAGGSQQGMIVGSSQSQNQHTQPESPSQQYGSGRRKSAHTGTDEWSRQRKDNHKEVERRRRGTINEGINELSRIVPNSSGAEKAKGAVLTRAVSYIHQLKENEARNIEKWTLEKLLMDQAIGDLQGQVEEMRKRWEEERAKSERLERELEALRDKDGDDRSRGGKRPRVD